MDINISANTLFHFTNKKQYLTSILTNGLYSRYSLESYESLIGEEAEIVFPMCCFCDIPLSQVSRHIKTYGSYGIGLTKNWGMNNKINPVIYSYPNSTTTEILSNISDQLSIFFDISNEELTKLKPLKKTSKNSLNFIEQFSDIHTDYKIKVNEKVLDINSTLGHFIKYIKPYEGKFYRDNDYLPNRVKFYDEREWRYVPDKDQLAKIPTKDSYKAEYYKDPVKRRAINIKIAKKCKLTFEPNDIKFIIVNKDKEIPQMLKEIERIFGERAKFDDLKLLGTRLISIEQILEDL